MAAIVGAVNLAESLRKYGHLKAQLDPLGKRPFGPSGDPSLAPEAHGLTPDDLRRLPASLIGGPIAARAANAFEAIEALRKVYCSTTGYDYAHVFVPEEREWLRHAAESGQFRPPVDPIDGADAARSASRRSRCSSGSCTARSRARRASRSKASTCWCRSSTRSSRTPPTAASRHAMIGMAHRGRLNVLAHILQKPYAQILAEFKDPVQQRNGCASTSGGWAT